MIGTECEFSGRSTIQTPELCSQLAIAYPGEQEIWQQVASKISNSVALGVVPPEQAIEAYSLATYDYTRLGALAEPPDSHVYPEGLAKEQAKAVLQVGGCVLRITSYGPNAVENMAGICGTFTQLRRAAEAAAASDAIAGQS